MKCRRTPAGAPDKEPSAASLAEMPEVDFSRAIQPHRYARLQTGYRFHVFVDPDVFAHFSSAERVNAALRMLVELASKRGRPKRPARRGSRRAA